MKESTARGRDLRLVPDRALPPYTYTGFPQPHPCNHPDGHSYGAPLPRVPPFEPDRWREHEEYLYGLDLFHHGYYWEAHEAWEALWVAAGKRGPVAEFAKGLIKLAAAGVKVRQENPAGVRRHAARARQHFRNTAEESGRRDFGGFDLEDLEAFAADIEARADAWPPRPGEDVAVVFERLPLRSEKSAEHDANGRETRSAKQNARKHEEPEEPSER